MGPGPFGLFLARALVGPNFWLALWALDFLGPILGLALLGLGPFGPNFGPWPIWALLGSNFEGYFLGFSVHVSPISFYFCFISHYFSLSRFT